MIVRLWHGRVQSPKAGSYREFLNRRAIPDYRSVPGNVSTRGYGRAIYFRDPDGLLIEARFYPQRRG